MKKLIYNNSILLFLNVNDMSTLKKNELKKIKEEYLLTYENCIIFNYFDLKNHKNIIKDKINKIKHISQTKINARECKISIIDNNQKNQFLNINHIQGTDKSQIFYGASFNNELISIMTFNDNRNMNGGLGEDEYELSRFSVKLGYIVSGIFNKILQTFIKEFHPKKIITYADYNLSNKKNNIYINNSFKLDKTIQPDYKILLKTNNQLYHKFTYGNKFFKDDSISKEKKEFIKNNSIYVWNCGKLRYVIRLTNNNEIIYGYIYLIKNLINGKVCVGQTDRTLAKRKWEYHSNFNNNECHNPYLLNAFKKYGWDNFEFTVIDTALNLDELNQKEIFYIKEYHSTDRNFGYNIEEGGNNSSPSDETLIKMSNAHLGIKQSDEWKDKRIAKAGSIEAKKYGKAKTDQEKLELSINSSKFWQGKKRDEETKKKISQTKLEKGLSNKQKETICKKVYKINPSSKEIIKIYSSATEASKIENVNQSTISRWCKEIKIVNNVLWSFKTLNNEIIENLFEEFELTKETNQLKNIKTEKLPRIISEETRQKLSDARKNIKQSQEWIDKRIDIVAKAVIKVDRKTNVIVEKFRSLADAGRFNNDNLSAESIQRKCSGGSKNDGTYIWCYEEDFINNTLPIFEETHNREFNTLSQSEIDEIYNHYKIDQISVRQLSKDYNVNFSTLNKYLKDLDKPELVFKENTTYVAICKKTGKTFVDYLNKSGALTTHIVENYPSFRLESKFKRKSIEEKTGKPWYYEYFDFKSR
jgi:group I intron endonuclease